MFNDWPIEFIIAMIHQYESTPATDRFNYERAMATHKELLRNCKWSDVRTDIACDASDAINAVVALTPYTYAADMPPLRIMVTHYIARIKHERAK